MATLVLAAAGAAIGGGVGGTILGITAAQIGFSVGAMAGSFIDQTLFAPSNRVEGPRMTDLAVQVSTYGKMIPILYAGRIAGNVIWSTEKREQRQESSSSGGKGGGGEVTTVEYLYSVSCALSLCEGPIAGLTRAWADSTLIWDAFADNPGDIDMTVYLGLPDQAPDSEIEAHEGAGQVPGYRDQAYVLFRDFHLNPYGNRIPNFTFEVTGSLSAGWGEELAAGVAVDTAGKAYLLASLQRTIARFDVETLTHEATIGRAGDGYLGTLAAQPWRVCIEPVSGHLFVTALCDACVQRIDPTTGALVATIPVGIYPHEIVADGAGDVWVTHPWLDRLSRIAGADNTVSTVAIAGEPYTIARKGDGTLFIGCTGRIVHFDPVSGNIIGTADTAAVGKWFPGGLAHNTAAIDDRMWFACSGNDVVGIVNNDYSLSFRNTGTWPLDCASHPDDPRHTVYVSLVFGNRVKLLRRGADYSLVEFFEWKTDVWPGPLAALPDGRCLVANINRPFLQEVEGPR
jgi:hypothetical protein